MAVWFEFEEQKSKLAVKYVVDCVISACMKHSYPDLPEDEWPKVVWCD